MIPKSSIALSSLFLCPTLVLYGFFQFMNYQSKSDEHVAKYFDQSIAKQLDSYFESLSLVTEKIDQTDFHKQYLECSSSLDLTVRLHGEQVSMLSQMKLGHKLVDECRVSAENAVKKGELSPLDPRVEKVFQKIQRFEDLYKKYLPLQQLRQDFVTFRKCELSTQSKTLEEINQSLTLWNSRQSETPTAQFHIYCCEKALRKISAKPNCD